MNEYYLTFRSLTLAQRASMELSRQGIPSQFLRTPQSLSTTGCGYSVRVDQMHFHAAKAYLYRAGIRYDKAIPVNSVIMTGEVSL